VDIKTNWPILAVGAGILYLASSAVTGNQGLAKWSELQRRELALQSELEVATQERALLEQRASKLKSAELDLDLVDERARELLGYARPDEVVLLPQGGSAVAQN
jgi:cell division protein FtsB